MIVEKERKVQQSIEEKEIQVEGLGKLEIVFKRFYICLGKKSKNTNKKILESYHRFQRMICTEKEKNILIVKNRKERSRGFFERPTKKRVYQTIKSPQNFPVFFVSKNNGKK